MEIEGIVSLKIFFFLQTLKNSLEKKHSFANNETILLDFNPTKLKMLYNNKKK